jgi:alpha/beta superfamily hydrolase
MADALAAAGFAALAYDHRNLGASDGEPRQEIDIWAQARDYRSAFDWLSARPEVDAARVALWGSSYSGGEVIVVGAADRRVAAVVAQVPFAGIATEYTDEQLAAWPVLRDALLSGERGAPADPFGPIAVVCQDEGGAAFLPQAESWRWFSAEGRRPGSTWRNEVTIRTDGGPVFFDPGLAIAHLAPTPLLMIVATEDRLAATDVALAAAARAGEPTELVLVEGDHFVPYGGEAFDVCRDATIAFLRSALERSRLDD